MQCCRYIVNPITTRGGGADYAHHITASSPGFENPAASLICKYTTKIFLKFLHLKRWSFLLLNLTFWFKILSLTK